METAMPSYRAYQIKDGHMRSAARIIEAGNDDAALAEAKQLVNGCDVELWHEARLVTTLWGSQPGTPERRR